MAQHYDRISHGEFEANNCCRCGMRVEASVSNLEPTAERRVCAECEVQDCYKRNPDYRLYNWRSAERQRTEGQLCVLCSQEVRGRDTSYHAFDGDAASVPWLPAVSLASIFGWTPGIELEL